jgi:hypothetical protein
MKGYLGGCAALISKDCPSAIYVHCASHSLNLVLSDACKVAAIRNAIGTMKEMITFIRASEKRMDTLKEQIARVEPGNRRTRLVKPSEKRWFERHDATSLFKEMFVPIYDTLGVNMKHLDGKGKELQINVKEKYKRYYSGINVLWLLGFN